MGQMAEMAATTVPRRGRAWVILALGLAVFVLGYAVVDISTQPAGRDTVEVTGISTMQKIFGGVPQAATASAPPTPRCRSRCSPTCSARAAATTSWGSSPAWSKAMRRPGEAKLLMRHYSVAENPLELGFFGAEAAAEQGYGWQYTYLFFRNQEEADRFGIGDEFLESLAGSIGELDVGEWREYLDRESGSDGAITDKARRLREARHRPRHPHPAGGDRQRPRRHPHSAGRPEPCRGRAGDRSGQVKIGAPGFEPGTSPTRTVRATRLRHAPKVGIISEGRPG